MGELGKDPITASEGKRLLSFKSVRFRYRPPGSINVPCVYEHFGALADAIHRVTGKLDIGLRDRCFPSDVRIADRSEPERN
jgi:hypothetical protein